MVTQERFTYLPNESPQEWLIPLAIRVFSANGGSKTVTTLLEGKRKAIEIGADAAAYKVNPGQNGFYRVRYHDEKM